MIHAAAIKTADGRIWASPRPGRHGDVCEVIAATIGYTINSKYDMAADARWWALMRPHVMGFVTDAGVFLDREEAAIHAKACRQIVLSVGRTVRHPVLGEGEILHIQPSDDRILGRLRVHVKFSRSSDENMWVPDDELELAGLTSEDVW